MAAATRTPVRFYFDPACPWTWITSRWVIEVSDHRGLDITWLPFSLRYKHKDDIKDEQVRRRMDDLHRGMRVIVAAQQRFGNDAVAALYTALGTLIHYDHDDHLEHLDEAIAAAGLPPGLIDAADEASLDTSIEVSTDSAKELVGDQVGVPIIVVDGAATTYFGPVMSPAPTGDEALELWDAFVALGRVRGVFEIKRTRTVGPQLGPRPELVERSAG